MTGVHLDPSVKPKVTKSQEKSTHLNFWNTKEIKSHRQKTSYVCIFNFQKYQKYHSQAYKILKSKQDTKSLKVTSIITIICMNMYTHLILTIKVIIDIEPQSYWQIIQKPPETIVGKDLRLPQPLPPQATWAQALGQNSS